MMTLISVSPWRGSFWLQIAVIIVPNVSGFVTHWTRKGSHWLLNYVPALPLALSACGLMLILAALIIIAAIVWPGSALLLPCGLLLQNFTKLVCHNKILLRMGRGCQHNPRQSRVWGVRRPLSLSASTCSCRHEGQTSAQVSRRIDTDKLTLTSRQTLHHQISTQDTGHTNGRKGKNIGENYRNWSMLWCLWSNSRNKGSVWLSTSFCDTPSI